MEKIKHQRHTKDTFLFASSRMLERASYYGLRSIILTYLLSESFKMDETEAMNIYSLFVISSFVGQIIGALLGDLVIGNRNSIIVGGILQSIGAFSFCIPSIFGIYSGLFLVALGSGLYTPNLISKFGKLYLTKTKLMDSGFTLFYLAVNLGAFAGVLLIAYFKGVFGWNSGFIIAGILVLFSILPILISKDKTDTRTYAPTEPLNRRVLYIVITFILVGLFWAIHDFSTVRIFEIQNALSKASSWSIPLSLLTSQDSVFALPVSILAIILWTYFYSSQFFKLLIGFIVGALSFGILLLIPELPNEQHLALYLIALLLMSISEIHISPIISSVLTQFSNPKYLAILISVAYIPTMLFSSAVWLFQNRLYKNSKDELFIGMMAMIIFSIGLIIYFQFNKKSAAKEVNE